MIKREWKKQNLLYMQDLTSKSHHGNRNKKLFNIVQFTMQYLPIITLILISLSLVLMELSHWEYVCVIAIPLEIIFKAYSWICIAFFQLSRLYYIFGDSRLINNNSKIKPYPNCLFIVTFIYGIGIIIYFSIIPWINFTIDSTFSGASVASDADQHVHDILGNECTSSPEMDAIFIFYVAWSIWFIVGLDWFILSLYFAKLCQFYKISKFTDNQNVNQNMKVLYNRISYILRKIVCLTILYEIVAIGMGIFRAYTHYNGNHYGFIIVHTTIALERIILCFVVVLMVEHNDNLYKKLMNGISYLCCLKCIKTFNCRSNKNNDDTVAQDSDINDSNGTKETPETHTTELDQDTNGELNDSVSSSVPVLSIGSAPKQLNITLAINH